MFNSGKSREIGVIPYVFLFLNKLLFKFVMACGYYDDEFVPASSNIEFVPESLNFDEEDLTMDSEEEIKSLAKKEGIY